MHLLYLTFGPNVQNHVQAAFSILTFLRPEQRTAVSSITVMTDQPAWYAHLADVVTIYPLTPAQLTDWRGPHDFFWRIKICGLQALAAQHPGEALLYLDTDTLLFGDAHELARTLQQGAPLMHQDEGALTAARSKTERLMTRQMAGKTFAGFHLAGHEHQWNAGVVAVPGALAAPTLARALALCDALCDADVTRRLIEQFSLSVALATAAEQAQTKLTAADFAIGHYWSTKALWQPKISAFLLESRLKNRSRTQELAALDALDMRDTPIGHHVPNTRQRLEKLARRWFPTTQERYVGDR